MGDIETSQFNKIFLKLEYQFWNFDLNFGIDKQKHDFKTFIVFFLESFFEPDFGING